MTEYMKAGQFKAKCLKVMDRVKRTRKGVVITKRNVPIAQLVPVEEKEISAFGKLKGTVHVLGDLLAPIDEAWDANH
ncbi:MAG TPA: type II toxin-antitoxin system prevent-host-death family antitoxin [Rhabdochlamydiaceae bacterium]|nr:type II toxin-antitoxin system prevent-host-death family antitoxin [Rhabdochlamydiaceae bacterium]